MPVPGNDLVDVLHANGMVSQCHSAAAFDWKERDGNLAVHGWRPATRQPPKPDDVTQGQVGGDHYAALGEYQPIEVLRRWLTPEEFRGWVKGETIVYLARERQKGGDKDLQKADHVLRYGMKLMGVEP
jgi:hypothetical protein